MKKYLATILCSLGILCCAYAAQAQTVVGVRSINFGKFYRGATSTVPYSSGNAAEFTITGRQNRNVRITVTNTSLTLGGNTLTLTLNNSDCAYSLDDGVTWHPFTTGALFQDTTLPNGTANGSDGTVRVRVGGSVTAGALQTNGTYNGTITVTGVYR